MATREPRPEWKLMRQLFDYVHTDLDRHGYHETLTVLMGRVRSHGTGAARQRAMLSQQATVSDVVDWLALTTKGASLPQGDR